MAEPLPRARFPVDLKEVRPKPRLPSRHRDRSAEANRDSVLLEGQPTEAACSSSPLEGAPAEASTPLLHSDPPAEAGSSYTSVRVRRPKPPDPSRRSRSSRQLAPLERTTCRNGRSW